MGIHQPLRVCVSFIYLNCVSILDLLNTTQLSSKHSTLLSATPDSANRSMDKHLSPISDKSNDNDFSCLCIPPDSGEGRNLVVCIDGSSNQFGKNNTNVIELYNNLIKDDAQLTYYKSGIGTYAKSSRKSLNYVKKVISSSVDLAVAYKFEETVLSAYRWLADMYQKGDKIYLFGFSRGAYQVRTIAGMIDTVGLIHKGNQEQIPFAYELYAYHISDESPEPSFWSRLRPGASKEKEKSHGVRNVLPADRFKETFSREDVRVHFTGVWDTVSSVGLVRNKSLPGTISLDHTCYFRHALALDECRVKFLPEYAHGGLALEKKATPTSDASSSPHIKEVWFSGTHSDVGGGHAENINLDRAHISLRWMLYEASSAGVRFRLKSTESKPLQIDERRKSSVPFPWMLLEIIPIKRLSYKDSQSTTRWLHLGRGRKMKPGQMVHSSVIFRKDRPKARLPVEWNKRWDELYNRDSKFGWGWDGLLEADIFVPALAPNIIDQIEGFDPKSAPQDLVKWVIYRLATMTLTDEGRGKLREVPNAARRTLSKISRYEITPQIIIVNAVLEFSTESDRKYLADLLWGNGGLGHTKEFLKRFISDPLASSVKADFVQAATNDRNLRQDILDSDILDGLFNMLADKDTGSVCRILVKLADNDEIRHKVLRFDVLRDLFDIEMAVIKNQETKVLEKVDWRAVCIIAGLSHKDDVRNKILKSNFVALLIHGFQHEKDSALISAAVSNMAKHDDLRRQLLAFNAVDVAVAGAVQENSKDRLSFLDVIIELSRYNNTRLELLRSKFVPITLKLVTQDVQAVRMGALRCIGEFVNHEDSRGELLDEDVLPILLPCLRDKNPTVVLLALAPIVDLAKHDDSHTILTDGDLITHLIYALRSEEWDTRKYALDAIKQLKQYEDIKNMMQEHHVFTTLVERSSRERNHT